MGARATVHVDLAGPPPSLLAGGSGTAEPSQKLSQKSGKRDRLNPEKTEREKNVLYGESNLFGMNEPLAGAG